MIRNKLKPLPVLTALIFLLLVPAGICAQANGTVITETQIRNIVKDHIEKSMQWDRAAMRIEFPVRLADQEFKGKKIAWQVQTRHNEEFIGESIFNVRFYDQEIFVREMPVRVRMEAAMDVVVSTKPLSRGAEIGPEDVKLVKKWFHRMPQNVLSDPEEAVGKTLCVSVGPNAEVTKIMLKTPRMVRKGALVKILAENGSLMITTVGLSEENGGRGDVIRVKNIASNKIVYAKVIDNALVRVEF